ncbi:MAG: TMEM175 family protein [Ferruginibacter sp.]
MKEKNLELERLVFFSDAIVAIAITLLVFDLKIQPADGHLRFADIANAWQKFLSFFLSFFIIAIFWKIHHEFYFYIRKINNRLLWYNIAWLMFIVILPFTTTLVSAHLFDEAAIFSYCINVLMVTLFQNQIWDYVAVRPAYLKENTDPELIRNFRISCNIAMLNALLAAGISFISPLAAFLILFTRLPMFSLASKFRWKKNIQLKKEENVTEK